tara:strand:- start:1167 stop:1376 length:210 start_codon:yes stop_codon:yes gene_type:complete
VDFNTIFFGLISVFSIAIFFFLGPLRASAKQRNREDRINWNQRRNPFFKIFIYALVSILGISLLIRFFF